MTEQPIKPVFIIGAPRSGTTLLYEILSNHKDLSYVNLNVLRTGVHRRGRILGYNKELLFWTQHLIHRSIKDNRPHEANNFWKKYFGIYNYLTEKDFRPEMADYYRSNVQRVQRIFRRPRFINKNPQHSVRVRLLNEIFKDAKFVHIIRDGRAAAYSMTIKIKSEPNDSYSVSLKDKVLGELYRDDRSKLYNYGLAWQAIVNRAREASTFGSRRYYELHYEDLIARPLDTIKSVLDFCELGWYDSFAKSIPKTPNENIKWKKELSEEEKFELEESTNNMRAILNYL